MNVWCSRICALILALAMMPGLVEVMENATHLVAEGHLAHSVAQDDQHEPTGPEHGCTAVFHLCGCHSSLAFVATRAAEATDLRFLGSSLRQASNSQLTGFWPAIDRPPQV